MKSMPAYLLAVVVVAGIILSISPPRARGANYLNVKGSGFTSLPVDARALGMGGAFVAIADNYSASYYNPAGLVHLPSSQLGSMYTDLYGIGLLNHSFFCFAEPDTGMGSGALSWSHLSADMEEDEWKSDLIAYSFAHSLFDNQSFPAHSWGINLKYIVHTTPYEDASGYGIDVSYLRKGKLSWGACVQNIVSEVNWATGHSGSIPANIMTGVAFSANSSSVLSLQIDSSPPEDIFKNIRLGGEWKLSKDFSLRAGVIQKIQKGENLNFSAGVGFKTGMPSKMNLFLDYAYTTYTQLPGTHYFSFSLNF